MGVGLLVFAVAIGGALVFSRRLTRPLRELAVAARTIAAGDWAGRVPVEGPAEARGDGRRVQPHDGDAGPLARAGQERAEELLGCLQRFRSVTDSANDAIISVNGRGEIVFWIQRAGGVRLRGAGGAWQVRHVSGPAARPGRYAAEFANLLSGHSPWIGSTVELHGRRKDGSEVPVELSLSTWKAGHDVFYTGVIRDITDRQQAAAALRQREDQLRQAQKMEAVGPARRRHRARLQQSAHGHSRLRRARAREAAGRGRRAEATCRRSSRPGAAPRR